jgi:hypothetical protein
MGWRINRNVSRALARCAAIIGIGCMITSAIAAPPTADTNRKAYDYAMRCMVAGGVTQGDQRYNPKGRNSVAIKAGMRRAYDALYRMGGILGIVQTDIGADFEAYRRLESRRMIGDDAYFQQTRASCQKLGLM